MNEFDHRILALLKLLKQFLKEQKRTFSLICPRRFDHWPSQQDYKPCTSFLK